MSTPSLKKRVSYLPTALPLNFSTYVEAKQLAARASRNMCVSRRQRRAGSVSDRSSSRAVLGKIVHQVAQSRIGGEVLAVIVVVDRAIGTLGFDHVADLDHVARGGLQIGVMARVHGSDHRRAERARFTFP